MVSKLYCKSSCDLKHIGKSLKRIIISFKHSKGAIAALGCGLGGLDWKDVKQLIKDTLSDIDFCTIYAIEPKV